uniref:GIY-YIG nuclease family protein n=1 Tax=Psychrobacter sp. TaxID=56811 RepID=UPI00159AE0E7|nr:GIY-YIG nuclease family protein [Psychrobacter sp.]QJS05940.1 hypothetical protein [Psychrobacter sp.]
MSLRELNENDGFIYVLTNAYIPNVYKIGYTTRNAVERAKEISRDTGVPGDWEVAREWPVMDAYKTEQYIFLEFKDYRIQKKEMFHFIGTSIEDLIKTMDILLSHRQKSLISYIENLNRYELRYKETIKSVRQAIVAAQYDSEYITYIRETVERVNRESTLVEISNTKGANKRLGIYIFVIVSLILFLTIQLGMGSILFYIFFAIVIFFMIASMKTNHDDIRNLNQRILKYSLDNLPKNLTELKPIMRSLDVNHIISINNIEIHMKKERRDIVLETSYKGIVLNQKYSCDEEGALIKFVMYVESEYLLRSNDKPNVRSNLL